MATETLTHNGVLMVHVCPTCFVAYAIPREMHREKQSEGGSWFCPNGHSIHFIVTKEQKLRDELEEAQRRALLAESSRDSWRSEAEREAASKRAIKGHLTRMRNKVANGVCPVPGCRRHFNNVAAHLQTEHEGWLADHDVLLGQA